MRSPESFLATVDEVDEILYRVKLLEWFRDHFVEFLVYAVVTREMFEGDAFADQHRDRASVLGPLISKSYRKWRRACLDASYDMTISVRW